MIAGFYTYRILSQARRDQISKTLTGRVLSPETLEKLKRIANSPERRAQHSAAMKGRPWSAARRAAQLRAA